MFYFFFMASLGFCGVNLIVALLRMLELIVESFLPICPPPRTGEFQTRWVYEDEEIIVIPRGKWNLVRR